MNDQNTIFKNYFLFANSVKDEYNVEDVIRFQIYQAEIFQLDYKKSNHIKFIMHVEK